VGIIRAAPTRDEELSLFGQGYSLVAGVDEAGRGPLAGPVVAAAVVLPQHPTGDWIASLRDSKQLSPNRREYLYHHLREHATAIGVGLVTSQEIDTLGIAPASRLAMSLAVGQMPLQPQYLLIDAFTLSQVHLPQKAIIHGDALCLSIAAASIVAKVTRDQIMQKEDALHPGYEFSRHKGYATQAHLRNLRRLGPCPIHRRSFAPVRQLISANHG